MTAKITEVFSSSNSIFIGNLDIRVKEEDIVNAFKLHYSTLHLNIGSMKIVHEYDTSYAFVSFPTLDSNQSSIVDTFGLKEAKVYLYNRKMHFSYIKSNLQFPEFNCLQEMEPIVGPYAKEAEDQNLPSVHVLMDEMLLHIFSYLKIDDIFSLGQVCRRFTSLVSTQCIKKLRQYKGGCFKSWLFSNDIPDTYQAARNILKYAGHILTKMEICKEFKDLQWTIFLISEFCPNLENLTISVKSSIQINYMERLGDKCPKLKILILKSKNSLRDQMFHVIFTKNRSLEVLQVYSKITVTHKCFRSAPESLKELSCFGKFGDDARSHKMSLWKKLFVACRQLEVLHINGKITFDVLKNAVRFCPNIKELWLIMDKGMEQFDWSLFPQLEKLSISSQRFDLDILRSNKHIEELSLNLMEEDSTEVVGSFYTVEGLKRLTVNVEPIPDNAVLGSISQCFNLVFLEINVKHSAFNIILRCIENLPHLTELLLRRVIISSPDVQLLVNAHTEQQKILRMTIGLDESAFQIVERLHEANYEVSIFDSRDLFVNNANLIVGILAGF